MFDGDYRAKKSGDHTIMSQQKSSKKKEISRCVTPLNVYTLNSLRVLASLSVALSEQF